MVFFYGYWLILVVIHDSKGKACSFSLRLLDTLWLKNKLIYIQIEYLKNIDTLNVKLYFVIVLVVVKVSKICVHVLQTSF